MPKIPIEISQTLGEYFKDHYPQVSYSLLQTWLRKGEVKYNSQPTNPQTLLEIGGLLKLPPAHFFPEIMAERPPIFSQVQAQEMLDNMTLWQNEDILVMNKPAGWAVQGGTGLDNIATIDGLVRAVNPAYCLTHRLDRETSGVMIIAKGRAAASLITAYFRDKKIQKIYKSLCWGRPNRQYQGVIDAPIADGPGGEFMVLDNNGREAITEWELIEEMGPINYLQLRPITGRKHQLRVHLAGYECPIIGDKKYGKRGENRQKYPNLLLHAEQIFIPNGPKPLHITAPLPEYFQKLL